VSGGDELDLSAVADLRAREVRVAFPIWTAPEDMRRVVRAYAERGSRLLPVAVFAKGKLPTAAEARVLGLWAREFGPGGDFWETRHGDELAVRAIEFGNETSYPNSGVSDRGGEYAERARDAIRALRRARNDPPVGLCV
jgi:hypothetical protein